MRLPGFIDVHVHMRDPGATYKEDWNTGTAAALAGGVTAVLAMPNTTPPVVDKLSLGMAIGPAKRKARCDFAQYIGAGPENAGKLQDIAHRTAGLKMYLDQTYGPLRLDSMLLWMEHLARWDSDYPIVAHAEGRSMAAVILLASLYNRPLHLAHVSTREEILIIRAAKEKGLKITCEVTPHHLFLTQAAIPTIGEGRSRVRPPLASAVDRISLWDNLGVIDCFASDHAPHTIPEKESQDAPPGFPGLETSLPLFLNAVDEGLLSLDDLVARVHTNPKRIFRLPEQPQTWIEVDMDESWEIRGERLETRCGWTPFEGWQVKGRLRQVMLRGREAFRDGEVLAPPGYGQDLRTMTFPG
jgi:carbamoyl-phosphate synthase/aspartate carbamoyltransferase/dihydroorotase